VTVSRVLAGWLFVTLCACRGDPDASLRAELRDLQARTVPVGARIVSESPITRDYWSVKASWDVDVAATWDDYVQHVREGLFEFTGRPRASGSAEFVKHLPGDTHMVRVEPLGAGSPLRVRISFSSFAR
jgi:hypothetical protein